MLSNILNWIYWITQNGLQKLAVHFKIENILLNVPKSAASPAATKQRTVGLLEIYQASSSFG